MERTAGSGRFGAASLLLRAADARGTPLVLLQRHAPASWGLPGAARQSDETLTGVALRAVEQAGVDPGTVRVRAARVDNPGQDVAAHPTVAHPTASYAVVIADIPAPVPARPHRESAWVPEPDVVTLDLAPALAARWPTLQAAEVGLLVDAANVVGSRPDGWWRDRLGAAERLLREIAGAGPSILALPGGHFRWVTWPVVVLEGAAKRASTDIAGVEVVRAPGSGDDTIVEVARRGGDWVVVTADRGLRARLPSGALPVGPSTLRSWLSGASPEEGRRGTQ